MSGIQSSGVQDDAHLDSACAHTRACGRRPLPPRAPCCARCALAAAAAAVGHQACTLALVVDPPPTLLLLRALHPRLLHG